MKLHRIDAKNYECRIKNGMFTVRKSIYWNNGGWVFEVNPARNVPVGKSPEGPDAAQVRQAWSKYEYDI